MTTDGIHCADCLLRLPDVPSNTVDLVFADLPYGRTQNDWDKLIPMDKLWTELGRVCKPAAPMIFTAMQPFAAMLVCSKLEWFRYEIVWKKNKSRGFLNANKQPLRIHETIQVFYREQPDYVPQMTFGHKPVHSYIKHTSDGTNYGKTKRGISGGGSTSRYPTSVLEIPVVNNRDQKRVNSTQKPEELAAWFIRTYTKPGDLVLDPTIGSGSTMAAAKRSCRRHLGFDTDPKQVESAIALLAGI